MIAEPKMIVVLAAVIERDGRFLVTRRPANTHLAGYWEFPGGKCEPGEAHDACLDRELREELGVGARVGREMLTTEHAYPSIAAEIIEDQAAPPIIVVVRNHGRAGIASAKRFNA